jgi:hypothetical protein
MSAYTAVEFVPDDLLWQPDSDLLHRIIHYFGTTTVSVIFYEGVLDNDEEHRAKKLLRLDDQSPVKALVEFEKRKDLTTSFILECPQWGDRIESSHRLISSDVSDGYVAWDVGLTIGPCVVWDPLCENKLFETMFALSISGNGMPTDLDEYLKQLRKTPEIEGLERFLRVIKPPAWQALISANF